MKFMITCEEALKNIKIQLDKNINKGKMGIFNFGYQVLDVQQIKYAQHLACMRKRKLRSYLSKHRSLRDKCFLEARKLPRFCKTKK